MIRLFPRLEEQIVSEQTPERLYTILKAAVDAGAEFTGQVHPFEFRIMPKLHWRNSFLPIAAGSIREHEGGAAVAVTLQMPILTRIFLACWFGLAGFGLLLGLFAAFTGGLKAAAFLLAPLGFMILGQVLVRCCFYGPARKTLERLKALLNYSNLQKYQNNG